MSTSDLPLLLSQMFVLGLIFAQTEKQRKICAVGTVLWLGIAIITMVLR